MKKKVLIIAAAVIVFAIAAFLILGRSVSINASCEQVARQLEAAGYTVTVVTDAEGLSGYDAEGMTAAVIAYKGAEKLEEPDEDKMADYDMVELFYFETEAQAEAYYNTDGFQLGYQAWSDAFYHIDVRDYNYRFSGNIAYAGTQAALDLCK